MRSTGGSRRRRRQPGSTAVSTNTTSTTNPTSSYTHFPALPASFISDSSALDDSESATTSSRLPQQQHQQQSYPLSLSTSGGNSSEEGFEYSIRRPTPPPPSVSPTRRHRKVRRAASSRPVSLAASYRTIVTIAVSLMLGLMIMILYFLHKISIDMQQETIIHTTNNNNNNKAHGTELVVKSHSSTIADSPTIVHPPVLPATTTSSTGTEKSYRSITYHDLSFQSHSVDAPSCDKPLQPMDIQFTLVTQVSEDRLWMMTQHCQRWAPGPISVAVFSNKTLPVLTQLLHQHELKYGSCLPNQITMSVLSTNHYQKDDYPVNILRNLALSKVQTSHIFYADSDFFISTNLYTVLHEDFVKDHLIRDSKLALVVPAFQIRQYCSKRPILPPNVDPLTQPECRDDTLPRVPKDFDSLTEMLISHKASAFDPTNRGGHGSTSYKEWFRMGEGDMWDLPCLLSNRYEPYLAVRYCYDYPPYQPAFTGYGKNKMTQIMHMRHTGYVFSQLGGVFVCHYPHPYAPARESWNAGMELRKLWIYNETFIRQTYGGPVDWTKFKRGQVDKIFIEFKKWLHNQVPDQARTPMCPDAFQDDMKLWLNTEDAPPGQRDFLLHPQVEPVAQ